MPTKQEYAKLKADPERYEKMKAKQKEYNRKKDDENRAKLLNDLSIGHIGGEDRLTNEYILCYKGISVRIPK